MAAYRGNIKRVMSLAATWAALGLAALPQCAKNQKPVEIIKKTDPSPPADPAPRRAVLAAARCEVTLLLAGRRLDYCVEYKDISPALAAGASDACATSGQGQFFTDEGCRLQGRIAGCAYKIDEVSFTYYYYLPMTRDEARESCRATSAGKSATAGSFIDMISTP